MRSLATNEIQKVSGAGYAEDIVAAAATIYVAGSISVITSGFVGAGCSAMTTMVGMAGIAPLTAAMGTMASVLTPVAALAAPFAVGAYILETNQGMQDALISKYHSYFG
ncbi:MAG: hypothetical protein HYX61_02685 [Gammaproteobacteria bacterium]|jgi:hypothetical protein|nr:hypothetical protein [Gammaproteobacteria bacterium]